MKILAIETSCDETAVSIVEASGTRKNPHFKPLAHLVSSQIALHQKWGGVVPSLAKREHARNLIPLLKQALKQADILERASRKPVNITIGAAAELSKILEREQDLLNQFLEFIPTIEKPEIDAIAVTQGPGLEPALWVGVNLAKALQLVWDLPVIAVNHLEGHLASVLVPSAEEQVPREVKFPAVALIVSGGHTELVLAKNWLEYEAVGATRDDAAGEAFDKVARLLGLSYPGGPAIARIAEHGSLKPDYALPRPMWNSGDLNFSFSGLKTAVLYLTRKLDPMTNIQRADIARQFQQAVIEVLLRKTLQAVEKHQPKTVIIGGGVAANQELAKQFAEAFAKTHPEVSLRLPPSELTGDNATMIAAAAYFHLLAKEAPADTATLAANGNLRLA